MTDPTTATSIINNPVVQYGFAGFCVLLLGMIVWLVKQLIRVIENNNAVIQQNTQSLLNTDKAATDCLGLMRHIHEEHMTTKKD